jgi:hypothetical protein
MTPKYSRNSSTPSQNQGNPSEQPIHGNNPNQDPHPLPGPPSRIPIRLKHTRSSDTALRRKIGLVHTVAPVATGVRPARELVDHHPLEDVCLAVVSTM